MCSHDMSLARVIETKVRCCFVGQVVILHWVDKAEAQSKPGLTIDIGRIKGVAGCVGTLPPKRKPPRPLIYYTIPSTTLPT